MSRKSKNKPLRHKINIVKQFFVLFVRDQAEDEADIISICELTPERLLCGNLQRFALFLQGFVFGIYLITYCKQSFHFRTWVIAGAKRTCNSRFFVSLVLETCQKLSNGSIFGNQGLKTVMLLKFLSSGLDIWHKKFL